MKRLIKIIIGLTFTSCLLFSQVSIGQSKIIRIKIKGGGGYHTKTILKFSLTDSPSSIRGKGKSDANDGNPRVGISTFNGDFYNFGDRGWVNLSRYANRTFYVNLDSKWGSEKDTYMELEVTVPSNCRVSYTEIDNNDDDLGYVKITEENIDTKIVQIKIKGGGGYHTKTILKFSLTDSPSSIRGRGRSDANDGNPRVGISTFNGDFYNFGDRGWVNLSRYANRTFYVNLDSKWGSEKDTYMELEVTVPSNCRVSYTEIDNNDDDLDYVRIIE